MKFFKRRFTILKVALFIIFIIGIGSFIAVCQYKNRVLSQTVGGYDFYYVEGTISNMGNYYVDVDSTKIYLDEIYSDDMSDNTFANINKPIHICLKGVTSNVYRVGSKVKITTLENPYSKEQISCIGLAVLEF